MGGLQLLLVVRAFPKFEAEAGRPASRAFGFRGEFDEYRVVTCTDADGRRHEVWALIEFELFRPRRVRWRAENPQDLPASARAMLERVLGLVLRHSLGL